MSVERLRSVLALIESELTNDPASVNLQNAVKQLRELIAWEALRQVSDVRGDS